MGETEVRVEDVTVAARDGYPLAASSFVPAGPVSSWVVVNSATAVPRAYYARFARFLAEQGFAAVTYD
ncbi:MAG TPA: alpha/beta hydrolase, partial [Vicinamibacteria bacterium]|nr:alpha/beta hydrolase [Vicinamibacteria bacterium]